jgi:outer membrane usher protein
VSFRPTLLPLSSALLGVLYCSSAHAGADNAAQFDLQTLQARGYSADLADFFSQTPRFLPGIQSVTVNVNASRSYRVDALFDGDGDLCFNAALSAELKLKHPAEANDCVDAAKTWPGMSVKLVPGQFRVELTIPENAFDPALRDTAFQSGGVGALLNYDLFMQRIDAHGSGTNYLQATLEPGLNLANWSIRNRGVFTQFQGKNTYQQQDAYAQRPIGALNALMQIGQISAFGDSFGGLPMLGVQIGTDSAQTGASQLVVPVQGIASTQATVEISQRGRVVYRTIVPPGPFMLSNVDGLTSGSDIDVQVIEANGQRQRFSLPARLTTGAVQQAASWTAGVGRYSNPASGPGEGGPRPPLAMGEYSYSPTDRLRTTTAGLFATSYQSLSEQATVTLSDSAWLAGGVRYAHTGDFGQGFEVNLLGSTIFGPNLSGSLTWLSRTPRYASSSDAFGSAGQLSGGARFRHSASASVAWSQPRWGALSYSVTHNAYYNDNTSNGFSHILGIGHRIRQASVNLSLQASPHHNFGIFANLSIPLGKGTLNSSVFRTTGGNVTTNTDYNGRFGQDSYYSLGVSGDKNDQRISGSMSTKTAYAQMGAGVSQTIGNTRSTYLSATGALAYADGLVGTGSNRVGDTFAVVHVPGQAGLRVTSPGSTSITNIAGTAVIPSITPYAKVELRFDTSSLPLNTRLATTTVDLGLTRNSVAARRIAATEVRQLLLDIRDGKGNAVPLGTTVYDDKGGVMGTIVGEGNFMLVNDDIGKTLRLGGTNPCQLSYEVPARFDPHEAYEEVPATCR